MARKQLALESIKELLGLAQEKDKALADRYVHLARKIAMKNKIKMPGALQKKFCMHCYHFLKPGVNLRVRTANKNVIYYCLDCKRFMKFPLKK